MKQLDQGLKIANGFLGRCPSCITTFAQHICELTCGAHQSDFIEVVKTKINDQTNQVFIDEIKFHINKHYTLGTFSSCGNVFVPSTGQRALDLMCGNWASRDCTDERWFTYMGDRDNETPNVPFQINYVFHNNSDTVNGFTPLNPRVVPCNESVDVSIPRILLFKANCD